MIASEIVNKLEALGCKLSVDGGDVTIKHCVDQYKTEKAPLFDELKANKVAALEYLRGRDLLSGFTSIDNKRDGKRYAITLDSSDGKALARMAYAVDNGLVTLSGKVRYRAKSGEVKVDYYYAFPPAWLPNHIDDHARARMEETKARLDNGKRWLIDNYGHANYGRYLEGFVSLWERFIKLLELLEIDAATALEV